MGLVEGVVGEGGGGRCRGGEGGRGVAGLCVVEVVAGEAANVSQSADLVP